MPVVRDYLQHQRDHSKTKPLSINTFSPSTYASSSSASHLSSVRDAPISPIIARKKFVVSQTPFSAQSEDEIQLGINDSAEEHKFTSYHLDYKYTPPIHKGPCYVCKNFIIGSMVTACEKMYCPGCFLCTNCGVELRPAYYKAHDESPYCRNCHSELFLPPCRQCGDYLGEHYLKVGEDYYHKPCFTCWKCKKQLDPKNFFERNGKLYCEDDYNNLFKPKCNKCFKPIIEDPINGGGKLYHKNCLSCHECKKSLNPNNFLEKHGNMYCPGCYHDLYSPKCVSCKKPVTTGDPVVAGGRPYHVPCFVCHECHKGLSPNNFKEKGSRIFCPDCYHNLYSTKCAACQKPIITPEDSITGNGKPYHRNRCFCCADCKRPLDPTNFFDKNNKLFCAPCYHRIYSPKCTFCQDPITTGDPLQVMGKQWHKNCFNCSDSQCQRKLNPNNFLERNDKPYCPDCFHRLFSAKCFACKQPIIGEFVTALGYTWHPDHFSCSNCSTRLSPQDFKERSGKLYCDDCFHNLFSRRCETCHLAIRDKAIYAMTKYYHPEHFSCKNCRRTLQESAFYEHDQNSYCEKCFLNLFAPTCRGCSQAITNQVYLFALGSDFHETCFRCMECKCQLDELTFYEFDGEPYCEEHYHARICPDCIKMRRAVERYLGQPEGSSSKPESVAAPRTLNLPLSRSGSRVSLHEETHHHKQTHQTTNKSPTTPSPTTPGSTTKIPIFKEQLDKSYSKNSFGPKSEKIRIENQNVNKSENKYKNETVKQLVQSKEQQEKQLEKEWDTLYSSWPEELNLNWKNSGFSVPIPHHTRGGGSGGAEPEYYRRDEALTKSSGVHPTDPNLQLESTFKKEICESITRY